LLDGQQHMMMDGHDNRMIANAICLEESTIKSHLRAIITTLEVNDRAQVAVVALLASVAKTLFAIAPNIKTLGNQTH
jgi:DNA-binding NarL/FixJ family response regulator